MAKEKLTEGANEKLTHLLELGDPDNEVATTWRAKESLRELYTYRDPTLASDHLDALISDFTDKERPLEVQLLGRTLGEWHDEILAQVLCDQWTDRVDEQPRPSGSSASPLG